MATVPRTLDTKAEAAYSMILTRLRVRMFLSLCVLIPRRHLSCDDDATVNSAHRWLQCSNFASPCRRRPGANCLTAGQVASLAGVAANLANLRTGTVQIERLPKPCFIATYFLAVGSYPCTFGRRAVEGVWHNIDATVDALISSYRHKMRWRGRGCALFLDFLGDIFSVRAKTSHCIYIFYVTPLLSSYTQCTLDQDP